MPIDDHDPFIEPRLSREVREKDALRRSFQVGGSHYARHQVQVWDIVSEYNLDFFEGNVLKYLLRKKEGADRLEDLQKARHYLDEKIRQIAAGREFTEESDG